MILTRVVSKLPMEAPVSPLQSGGPEAVREASRAKARRRWILRSSLLLTLSAVVLVLLVILQRNQSTVDSTLRAANQEVRGLQEVVDELGQLPAFWTRRSSMPIQYLGDEVRAYARHTDARVIVAHTGAVPLVLQNDGLVVILYEKGKLRAEWWKLPEFVGRLQAQERRIEELEEQIRSQPPVLP